jgi:hypothetical protein
MAAIVTTVIVLRQHGKFYNPSSLNAFLLLQLSLNPAATQDTLTFLALGRGPSRHTSGRFPYARSSRPGQATHKSASNEGHVRGSCGLFPTKSSSVGIDRAGQRITKRGTSTRTWFAGCGASIGLWLAASAARSGRRNGLLLRTRARSSIGNKV